MHLCNLVKFQIHDSSIDRLKLNEISITVGQQSVSFKLNPQSGELSAKSKTNAMLVVVREEDDVQVQIYPFPVVESLENRAHVALAPFEVTNLVLKPKDFILLVLPLILEETKLQIAKIDLFGSIQYASEHKSSEEAAKQLIAAVQNYPALKDTASVFAMMVGEGRMPKDMHGASIDFGNNDALQVKKGEYWSYPIGYIEGEELVETEEIITPSTRKRAREEDGDDNPNKIPRPNDEDKERKKD